MLLRIKFRRRTEFANAFIIIEPKVYAVMEAVKKLRCNRRWKPAPHMNRMGTREFKEALETLYREVAPLDNEDHASKQEWNEMAEQWYDLALSFAAQSLRSMNFAD